MKGQLSVSARATLACIWEATAPKPGNVYRGADFDDITYADFLTSAAITGPLLESTAERGVGRTVLECVRAMRQAVGTNTNLGTLLLLAPLSIVRTDEGSSVEALEEVLTSLGPDDTANVYEAIRLAHAGGIGKVPEADVGKDPPPNLSLVEAMRLAADRDLVARQFVNGFGDVFQMADRLADGVHQGACLSDAIVQAFLQLLASEPDSLICRKCGQSIASEASARAATVLEQGAPGSAAYDNAVADLDFWLRGDGHRRNPGTSADLVAAGLFVLLGDDRLDWPVKFYRT